MEGRRVCQDVTDFFSPTLGELARQPAEPLQLLIQLSITSVSLCSETRDVHLTTVELVLVFISFC